jgi:hypothetical protein
LETAGRIEIEDAAAHGIFAMLHDRARAPETGLLQAPHELVHVDVLARREGFQRLANKLARRHALQGGIDRRDDDGRLAPPGGRENGQRGQPLGNDLGIGRDAVVGHAIPGRDGDHAHMWSKEGQGGGERLEPPVVAGDVHQDGLLGR